MFKRFSRWRHLSAQRLTMPALSVIVFGGLGIYFLTASHASPIAGGAVQIYLSPVSGTAVQGQTVTVDVHVKTNAETINAVQADLTYPTAGLQYVSTSGVCVDPPFGITAQNTGGAGVVTLACGSISGVNGDFVMGTLTFNVVGSSGSAAIGVANTSSALRKTDNGETLGSATGASFTLTAPAPAITSVAPAGGSTLGGTAVTITGSNFSGTPSVKFGTASATNVVVVNATTITATAPAGSPGAASVSVVIGTQTATKASAFSYSDTTPPSVPGGLTATSTGSYQVALSWTASSDTGGGTVAGYKVYRNGTLVTSTPLTGTAYTDSGLTALTAYSYTVQAVDSAGNASAQSTALNVTTRRKGDVNNDGKVDLTDLSRLLSKFGQTVAAGTSEDVDQNGSIGLSDLSVLLSNFGK